MNDDETWVEGGVVPTLNSFDCGDTRTTVVIVFAPGPMIRLGGTNIWEGIVPTLRAEAHGGDAQPYIVQETDMTDPTLSFDTQFGSNANVFEDVAPTMKASQQSPSVAYDEYNDQLGGEVHHALRAGTRQSTGVMSGMVVRRLSPVECERLMGWPDHHTLPRADGKTNSDTTRYKMCGNGVASPVAKWIGEQLMGVPNE